MPLFTFIAEYEGGVYIRQVHGRSVSDAAHGWIGLIFDGAVEGLTADSREEFEDQLEDDSHREDLATAVKDCIGVWRLSFVDCEGKVMVVLAVRTHESVEGAE